MMLLKNFIISLVFICLAGCSFYDKTSNEVLKKSRGENYKTIFVTEKKDSVFLYIMIQNNNKFSLTTGSIPEIRGNRHFYFGSYTFNSDTFHLTFFYDHSPKEIDDYFITDKEKQFLTVSYKNGEQVQLKIINPR